MVRAWGQSVAILCKCKGLVPPGNIASHRGHCGVIVGFQASGCLYLYYQVKHLRSLMQDIDDLRFCPY